MKCRTIHYTGITSIQIYIVAIWYSGKDLELRLRSITAMDSCGDPRVDLRWALTEANAFINSIVWVNFDLPRDLNRYISGASSRCVIFFLLILILLIHIIRSRLQSKVCPDPISQRRAGDTSKAPTRICDWLLNWAQILLRQMLGLFVSNHLYYAPFCFIFVSIFSMNLVWSASRLAIVETFWDLQLRDSGTKPAHTKRKWAMRILQAWKYE